MQDRSGRSEGKRPQRAEFERQALPYLDELYAVALRYTRNVEDAKDLVQDTYLRAYAAWDRFLEGSNCRAWMLRILVNGFITTVRRGRSHQKFASRPGDEPVTAFYGEATRERAADPEGVLVRAGMSDEVTAALDALGEDYRTVVLLADVAGLTYKEIAEMLRVPVGTIMSRLFRARRQLEARLAPYAASDYGIARRQLAA